MTDQQTKNRRIHELMGLCWHDWSQTDQAKHFPSVWCHKCGTLLYAVGVTNPKGPDYYNSIEHAREALQFAVDQKGATVVDRVLYDKLGLKNEHGLWWITKAALAPPEVLCEAFLAVYEK